MYKESMANMPNKFPCGKTEAEIGQLMYDENIGTIETQFNTFDAAFNTKHIKYKDLHSFLLGSLTLK